MSRFGLATLITLVAAAIVLAAPSAEAAAGSLSITPPTQTVNGGSSFPVAIVQDSDVATSGAQTDFVFNSSLLQVVGVELGSAYAGASLVVGVAPQTTEQAIAEANTSGTLQNVSAFFLPGAGSVPAAPANFVVLNLEAVSGAGGVSPITLLEPEMLDEGGESVPVSVVAGEVMVIGGASLVWGDVNCGGTVNSVDALALLRSSAGLTYSSAPGCPAIGALVESRVWGDVNCGGSVNAVDALTVLRSSAGLTYNSAPSCPEIGSVYP